MDLEPGSGYFRLQVLVLTVLVVFSAGFLLSSGGSSEEDGRPNNSIVSAEKEVYASNLGTRYEISVELVNGSEFVYEKYDSHHPLCPEQPEKCGEDSRDPGWREVEGLIQGENFTEMENNSFRPKIWICMSSRTTFRVC